MSRPDLRRDLAAWIISIMACTAATLAQPATAPILRNPELAPTPPMGWNSWNACQSHPDEQTIKRQADLMVQTGLRDAGYRYFVIDGGWRADQRAADGTLARRRSMFPVAAS